jgi:hypothetical protein
MPESARYQRSPLANAETIVPVGLHVAPDGSLVFDPPDEELLNDLRLLIAVFAAQYPSGSAAGNRFRRTVLPLAAQKAVMSEVIEALLAQMGSPDGGDRYSAATMLASAFDRFPQFADFLDLATGCGDPNVDPAHRDHLLSRELGGGPVA